MTTLQIEIALMRGLEFTKNLMVPTVKAGGLVRFETDMLMLSKAGYATAIEIKISKSDLKADSKKAHIKNTGKVIYGKSWKEKYFPKVKYFYYAVPDDLLELALTTVHKDFGIYTVRGKSIFIARPAKVISNYKWNDKERYALARLGALRIFGYKLKQL